MKGKKKSGFFGGLFKKKGKDDSPKTKGGFGKTKKAPVQEEVVEEAPPAAVPSDAAAGDESVIGNEQTVFAKQKGAKVSKDDFELLKVIGKGSFGKVMLVRKKDDGAVYAMKVLRKDAIIKRRQVAHTRAEKDILTKLKHPFIVNLNYAFQTPDRLFMILDFINGGELFFHLKNEGRFSESRVQLYAAEIACAMEHCHSLGVVYRDIKPENILISNRGHIVITDFGLCKQIDDGGTKTFCVPEDHQVLTEEGWMDLRAFEARARMPRVAGYDARRQLLVYEAPRRLLVLPKEERELVEFQAGAISYQVTRDHEVYGSLSPSHAPTKHKAGLFVSRHETLCHVTAAAGGLAPNNEFAVPLGLASPNKRAAFLELCGLWVARGGFKQLRDEELAWLAGAFSRAGLAADEWAREGARGVRVLAPAWRAFFAQERALHVPRWAWSAPRDDMRCLLRGIERAGGLCTASVNFRDQLVRAALHAGYSASFCAEGARYRVSYGEERGTEVTARSRSVCGRVWCLTMPSGFFWVRRAHRDAAGAVVDASRPVLTGNCGTPEYLAPEVLKGQAHGLPVDWWSLGTLTYEMLTGLPPFYSQNINEMYEKILYDPLTFPAFLSDDCVSFLEGLLTRDPDDRLGSDGDGAQVLAHPWLAHFDKDKLLATDYQPEFVPKPSSATSTEYVDEVFLAEGVDDSDSGEGGGGGDDDEFTGFTFVGESAMGV